MSDACRPQVGRFSVKIYLEAAKFVMLRVFALVETDLTKNESQTTGEYCKKSMTSGWRSSLKNFFSWTPHLGWEETGRLPPPPPPFPKSRASYFRFPRFNTSHYTIWEPCISYSPLHSWNLSFWTPLFIYYLYSGDTTFGPEKMFTNLCICYRLLKGPVIYSGDTYSRRFPLKRGSTVQAGKKVPRKQN